MSNRLDIGGSKNLDTTGMELSSSVCGHSDKNGNDALIKMNNEKNVTRMFEQLNKRFVSSSPFFFSQIGPEQAIMCGVTTVRLVSNGNHNNQARITIRSANVDDIDIATLICPE